MRTLHDIALDALETEVLEFLAYEQIFQGYPFESLYDIPFSLSMGKEFKSSGSRLAWQQALFVDMVRVYYYMRDHVKGKSAKSASARIVICGPKDKYTFYPISPESEPDNSQNCASLSVEDPIEKFLREHSYKPQEPFFTYQTMKTYLFRDFSFAKNAGWTAGKGAREDLIENAFREVEYCFYRKGFWNRTLVVPDCVLTSYGETRVLAAFLYAARAHLDFIPHYERINVDTDYCRKIWTRCLRFREGPYLMNAKMKERDLREDRENMKERVLEEIIHQHRQLS